VLEQPSKPEWVRSGPPFRRAPHADAGRVGAWQTARRRLIKPFEDRSIRRPGRGAVLGRGLVQCRVRAPNAEVNTARMKSDSAVPNCSGNACKRCVIGQP